jgi:hypothetical protein
MHARKRVFLSLLAVAVAVLAFAEASPAQTACGDNFPWTVTGTDIPGGVVVNACGHWAGCFPHDPRASVSDNQIQITFDAGGSVPGCSQCTASDYPFSQNVFVPSLPAGTYAVTVSVWYRGQPQPQIVGTGSVVSGGLAAIPVLDRAGLSALVLLLAAVAVWKLRS